MIITLNRWNILFSEFADFLRYQTGEVFESFQTSPYLEQEEMYKYSIFDEAQRQLRVEEWEVSRVGTGVIKNHVEATLFPTVEHNGRVTKNNLFDWRKRDEFERLPATAELERLFFDFYTDAIPNADAFQRLFGAGIPYQLIAYFFFIKDRLRFLPIAQETFDRFFAKKLGTDFRTSRHASWENYETYLEVIRSAQEFLQRIDSGATFLDAHSFVWILARQREEWLAQHGIEEEPLQERHFLQYWVPEQVAKDLATGRELEHGGSNQYDLRGVSVGDVVWIVTVRRTGQFILAGRIGVDQIVTHDEAVAMFPDNEVFDRRLHIVASRENAELMAEIEIDDIAEELRFDSDQDRLTLVGGRVDAKQLQTMRRLTAGSASLIANKWTSLPSQIWVTEKGDDAEERRIKALPIGSLEKEQLIKSRRGQGRFKQNLCNIETRCRVTDLTDKRFLIASHIKPWRHSSDSEKLDGNNGLLLSPHVDKLFDLGHISFTDDGEILCRSEDVRTLMELWNLDADRNVGRFNSRQKEYLAYHRSLFQFPLPG